LKNPGPHQKGPGVLFKGPRGPFRRTPVSFGKDPCVILRRPRGPLKGRSKAGITLRGPPSIAGGGPGHEPARKISPAYIFFKTFGKSGNSILGFSNHAGFWTRDRPFWGSKRSWNCRVAAIMVQANVRVRSTICRVGPPHLSSGKLMYGARFSQSPFACFPLARPGRGARASARSTAILRVGTAILRVGIFSLLFGQSSPPVSHHQLTVLTSVGGTCGHASYDGLWWKLIRWVTSSVGHFSA